MPPGRCCASPWAVKFSLSCPRRISGSFCHSHIRHRGSKDSTQYAPLYFFSTLLAAAASASALPRSAFSSTISGARSVNSGSTSSSRGILCSVPSSGYWSSASGALDGVPFGFNLGYGFGDTSAATENALFHGGRLHKLTDVDFGIPQRDGKPDFLSPWHFTSSDGRFTAEFRPILDRAACTDFQLLKSDQHQVFGRFTGECVLDDGTALSFRDFPGFAEQVENKW